MFDIILVSIVNSAVVYKYE